MTTEDKRMATLVFATVDGTEINPVDFVDVLRQYADALESSLGE